MYLNACHELDDLGGGRFRWTGSLRPVAYRADGSLREIARSWVDSGIEGRPHVVTAAPLMVSAGNDGTRRIHPTREQDRYLELGAPFVRVAGTWTQVALGTPDRSANFLRWTTANANLYLAHAGHYVKLGILLKGGWQPADGLIAFPFALSGLTWSAGRLLADGEPVMRLRPPLVYDLDNPETTRPIGWEFVTLGGQQYALLTLPDLTGISRPLIDPTFETQPSSAAGQNTHLNASNTNKHYGGDDNVIGEVGDRHWLIKFDCSSIPGDATCVSATLSLYAYESDGTNRTHTIYSILAANDGWDTGATADPGYGLSVWDHKLEETSGGAGNEVNWAGSAGCNTSGTDFAATAIGSIVYTTPNAAGTESTAALTAATVETWFGASNSNYGMIGGRNTGNAWKKWGSCNHATAGYRPKLVVVYSQEFIAQFAGISWASVGQVAGVAEAAIDQIAGVKAN